MQRQLLDSNLLRKSVFSPQLIAGGTLGLLLCALAFIPQDALVYLFGGVLVLFATTLIIWQPQLWTIAFVFSLPFWILTGTDPELRLDEVLVAGFYICSVVLWFAKAIITRQRIVWNEIDAGIIFFFAFATIPNFIVAYLNHVEPLRWIRVWGLIVTMLLYFPLRDFLRTRAQQKRFLIALAFVTVLASLMTAYQYWRATTDIRYAYEIISARVTENTGLFLGAAIIGLLAALMVEKGAAKIILFLYQTGMAISLIVSFYRSYWIAYAVAVAVLFWYLRKDQKFQLLFFAFIGIATAVLIFLLFFRSYADIALRMLEYRVSSIGRGTQDISLADRVSETEVVLRLIKEHPLEGYGLGSTFTYYSPIRKYHNETFYVHSTYLFAVLKFGFPLAIIFIVSLFLGVFRAIQWGKRAGTIEQKIYLFGAGLILIALLVTGLTTCIIYTRSLLLALCIAFLFLSWGLEYAGYHWQYAQRQGTEKTGVIRP